MRIFPIIVALIVSAALYLLTFERDTLMRFSNFKFSPNTVKKENLLPKVKSNNTTDKPSKMFSVVVKKSIAADLDKMIVLRGRSEATRQVNVRSQTTGLIVSSPLAKGSKIKKNQILCELDPGTKLIALADVISKLDDAKARTPQAISRVTDANAKLSEALARTPEAKSRVDESEAALVEANARIPESNSRVKEAEARLVEAKINYSAAKKLKAGGYASESRLASNEALKQQAVANLETAKVGVTTAKARIKSAIANIETAKAGVEATKARIKSAIANVETAKAGVLSAKALIGSAQSSVAAAKEELSRLEIHAPFSGFLETNTAELGSLMQPGSLCATIVDLSTVKLVGFVSENSVSQIKLGAKAQGITSAGQKAVGKVTFISKSADPATRTFRLEVSTDNSSGTLIDGQTVEISVVSDGETAHLIPASSLTLNSLGEMGVRLVNGNRSKFKAVQLIRDTTKGVWVSGLKSEEEIVIIGQEYLTDEVEITISYLEH